MKITLLTIGHFKNNPLKNIFGTYVKRLDVNVLLREIKLDKNNTIETKNLISKIPKNSYTIALDRDGENINSLKFSKIITQVQQKNIKNLVFLIGGPKGLTKEAYETCDLTIALGKVTWPHLIVRILLIEQIYRAQQIEKKHPYHQS